MSYKARIIAVIAIAGFMSGCSSSFREGRTSLCDPHVSQLGPATFIAEANCAKAGPGIEAANYVCTQVGMKTIVTNIQNNDVIFQCLDASDPEYQRPAYTKPADIVIKDSRD